MKKRVKLVFNLVIFLIVIGFVWYMAKSINSDKESGLGRAAQPAELFDSPYVMATSIELSENVNRIDLYNDMLFVAAEQTVYVLDIEGVETGRFPVDSGVRDIAVSGNEVFLLYPKQIAVYNYVDLQLVRQWEACSNLSDYCSFAVSGNSVFVTDADNKNICQYTADGDFVRFINSPAGFIIPSYSFDIDVWNDTLYVSNSGRHQIETYTLEGDFIFAFGSSGAAAGSFAGCCNPVFFTFTPEGTLVTSEKGNPRVSKFTRCGNFEEVALNSGMLGTGTHAREVRATDDKLFVATRNLIMVFKLI